MANVGLLSSSNRTIMYSFEWFIIFTFDLGPVRGARRGISRKWRQIGRNVATVVKFHLYYAPSLGIFTLDLDRF